MKEYQVKFYSPNLNTETEMLVFGDSGYPIILFPTSMGRQNQNKDFKLIESAKDFVESGKVKIYCVDGVDEESWYNKVVSPEQRVKNHLWYDKFIREEVIPMAQRDTGFQKVGMAGCSFGGYHAANIAFRYPEVVGYMIAMGAGFDIKNQLDGYYDDNVYYNNPPDFLGGLSHPDLWKMGIILGTGTEDFCLPQNERLSEILTQKNVNHWLDVRPGGIHDWPLWREMFPHYLWQIKEIR
jgi:esterase/lipase superfamily enzyme